MSNRKARRSWQAWVLATLAFGWAGAAAAQTEPAQGAPPPPVEEPAVVPLPEIAARSEQLRASLREATARLAPRPEVGAIADRLPDVQAAVDEQLAAWEALLEGSPSLDRLADTERAWTSRWSELSGWRNTLAKRAALMEAELAALQKHRELWDRTLARARESEAPPDVISAVRANLQAIASTRKLAIESRSALLTLLNQVAQEEGRADDARSAVSSARAEIQARILEPDSAPLWAAFSGTGTVSSIPGRVREDLESDRLKVAQFLGERARGFVLVAVVFAAALATALFVRARLRESTPDAALAGSVQALERPYSIAAIAAFLAGFAAFPFAPAIGTRLVGALIVVPVLRVVNPLLHEAFRPILYVLTGFYLVDRVRDFVDSVALLERSLFFVQTVGGTAFLVWLLRPSRLSSFPSDGERPPSGLRTAIRLATGLLAGSAVANLLGYTTFGRVLGEGVLQTAYLSILFYAAFRVGLTAILVSLASARAQRSNLVRSQGPLLLRGGRLLLALGLGFFWAENVLDAFAIKANVIGAVTALLTTPLTLGTVSLSLGDVLVFGLTIATAVLLSRLIRILLSDDVLPRFSLNRGVANAITTSVRYFILLAGFFFALGAAGVDLSRFALLAGAFGVGIGFGLQNVVNNFVSGLILLFERPIQVGDTIEVGGLLGDVKQIGIRASMVRTVQGAEVIVPNGNLISTEVINWTLSDRHRRVELPVGVAYGNRPARVIEVLEAVVANEPGVLRLPPPLVLFRGFGDSSLDFEVRLWAADYSAFLQLRSDVASAIYDALDEEGIEIPFPQRDLHLKSVEGAAAARLIGGGDPK